MTKPAPKGFHATRSPNRRACANGGIWTPGKDRTRSSRAEAVRQRNRNDGDFFSWCSGLSYSAQPLRSLRTYYLAGNTEKKRGQRRKGAILEDALRMHVVNQDTRRLKEAVPISIDPNLQRPYSLESNALDHPMAGVQQGEATRANPL